MKKTLYAITFILTTIFAAFPAEAAVAPKDTSLFLLRKKVLVERNRRMSAEIDSLKALLEAYESQEAAQDSINGEIYDLYSENEDKIGAGLDPEDYNDAVTDSLMDFWYVHRSARRNTEGENYNMDSVKFTSNVPDKVFMDRLSSMNSYITLPYNETVRNYIILYSEKMPTKMSQMLGLSNFYFPIFEETFAKYDLPLELKYMAVIESALNPIAVSRAGAKGMWQFMYNTAKIYGLTIDSYVDERLDPVKAADAAARYLADSYGVFGDWNLAISSYNCGAGNVNKAIKRSGSRDFWKIYDYLPRETRGYVPAFVGAMYAFRYYKEHGMKPAEVAMPVQVDTFQVNKMLHFKQISEVAGIPMDVIKSLNPQYIHDIIPGDKGYLLRLPYNYTSAFLEHEDSIYNYKRDSLLGQKVMKDISSGTSSGSTRIVYKVRKGDYLGKIAARYHVSVSKIRQWNHLRSNNLRIGQTLVIYRGGSGPAVSSTKSSTKAQTTTKAQSTTKAKTTSSGSSSSGETVYTVRSGDTLYEIARKYPGVSANDIMKYNGITSSKIRPGMKLKIPKKS